jgi:hypothetical protein
MSPIRTRASAPISASRPIVFPLPSVVPHARVTELDESAPTYTVSSGPPRPIRGKKRSAKSRKNRCKSVSISVSQAYDTGRAVYSDSLAREDSCGSARHTTFVFSARNHNSTAGHFPTPPSLRIPDAQPPARGGRDQSHFAVLRPPESHRQSELQLSSACFLANRLQRPLHEQFQLELRS